MVDEWPATCNLSRCNHVNVEFVPKFYAFRDSQNCWCKDEFGQTLGVSDLLAPAFGTYGAPNGSR